MLGLHVLRTHELIAEILQALDSLLQVAERILWVVEEARYAISNYERAQTVQGLQDLGYQFESPQDV